MFVLMRGDPLTAKLLELEVQERFCDRSHAAFVSQGLNEEGAAFARVSGQK